jgi:glucose/arabinose dehydrogenase
MRTLFAAAFFLVFSLGNSAGETRYRAVPAFPRLSFENPLFLAAPPAGPDRLFVVEQAGRVLWFENRADAGQVREALDIRKKVRTVHNEEGLLGLAFHPEFKDNGFVFLQYSAGEPRRNVISRFAMDAASGRIDPASEKIVLEVPQPYGNHNGGMLAFGPDGFLYIGLGDGGAANDPHDHGQDMRTLLGKMLRIDVDRAEGGKAYSVPRDNPFAGRAGARGEIWASGLRNPWRYSFDRQTGELWAGDVGQNKWEEIDVIEKGKNYGWNRREGRHPSRATGRPEDFEDPVAEHGREEAQSITGGYVYRGERLPELRGHYIYGDFMSGLIWALDAAARGEPRLIARGELISSFGEDRAGELYFTSFDGRIYRLEK